MPRIHNLTQVLVTFAAGYAVYVGCCAMTVYTSMEREYVRGLLRSQFRSRLRKREPILSGEP